MAARRRTSEIKAGVIGYGGAFGMGKGHLQERAAVGMTPTAVADTDPRRLKAAAEEFPGIETYPSAAQMLRRSAVDVVAIITPHNTHAALAVQCLRAGRHVVVEKPFAITTAECDRMIAAARKGRRLLSTYHNRHWDGCIIQAVKTVRSRAIGQVVRVEAHMGSWGKPRNWWRTSKTISGGILYDWGVHLMEYTFQIIDSPIVEVAGFAKKGFWAPRTAWKADTFEDESYAVVRYAGGAWSSLMITQLDSKPKAGQVEITGTKGTYVFDYRTYELITHGRDGSTVTRKGANPPSQHERFYRNIADHLRRGTKLVITPQWARRPVHVIDLACRSAAAGKALKAKYR